MNRVPTLPGTWLLMLFAVIPILAAGVASAAPGYPVEDRSATEFTVSYGSANNVLSLSTSTAEEPDTATQGVDAASSDVSVSIVGPNGQVNHGQIVRQVHELAEGRYLGCITRTVAQSDVGKGDQQVRPHEQSTSSDVTETVDSSVLEGDCANIDVSGKPLPAAASENRTNARDTPQGKFADAPGKNK